MKVKYYQYAYGGCYTDEVLECPDDTLIIPIEMQYISYKVSDLEWTKDYLVVIKGKGSFFKTEDFAPVFTYGDYFVGMLNHIKFVNPRPLNTLEDVTKIFNGVFFEYRQDDESSLKNLFNSVSLEEYIKQSKKYTNVLTELCKVFRFTPVGIEVGSVSFLDHWFDNLPKIETYTIPYKQVIKTEAVGGCEKIFRDRIKEILENY